MPKRNVITFVGDLSVFYDRQILRATARRLESDPNLRHYSLCHLQPWDIDQIDIDASAGALLGWLPDEPKRIRKLVARGVPVVEISGAATIPWIKYSVRTDDEAVGRAAAKHFLMRLSLLRTAGPWRAFGHGATASGLYGGCHRSEFHRAAFSRYA